MWLYFRCADHTPRAERFEDDALLDEFAWTRCEMSMGHGMGQLDQLSHERSRASTSRGRWLVVAGGWWRAGGVGWAIHGGVVDGG